MSAYIIISVFIVSTVIGYLVIRKVPSLLHTPLMSGMNALSGITILGAITTLAILTKEHSSILSSIFAGLAVVLATINVVGGFGVTHRMLRMFDKKEGKNE